MNTFAEIDYAEYPFEWRFRCPDPECKSYDIHLASVLVDTGDSMCNKCGTSGKPKYFNPFYQYDYTIEEIYAAALVANRRLLLAKAHLDELLKSPEIQTQEATVGTHQDMMDLVDFALRNRMIDQFMEDGEKQIADGLGVMERKELEYDELVAIDWCIQHYPNALKLNPGLFKKYVEAKIYIDQPLDFVNVHTEVATRVRYPKKIDDAV